jgi:dipeptidyl aminopeptidase/acylaminoacyl peptidase
MKIIVKLILLLINIFFASSFSSAQSFDLESIKSYPFPTSLTSAAKGSKIAWAFDEQGKRNVFVAEGPDFKARNITGYLDDDGQEISSLILSVDGNWVIFVRGGDHGSIWDESEPVNVNSLVQAPKVEIHAVSFDGKRHLQISEGDNPVIAPNGKQIAFTKKGQVWIADIDGTSPAKQLFTIRGSASDLQWSPDGSSIAFVANRQDHAFIGVFKLAGQALRYVAASFSRDRSPRWSPDGESIAFVRTPGAGGAPDSILTSKHQPWSIWKADIEQGKGTQLWKAPSTLAGNLPATNGGSNLNWTANGRIVFVSAHDGWSHLYSMSDAGSMPKLLTPGNYMVEHIKLSLDNNTIYFSANTGKDAKDIDRRHIAGVSVDRADMKVLSEGANLEWTPIITGDGKHLAFLTSIGQQPPLPAVVEMSKLGKFSASLRLIAKEAIPSSYPDAKLKVPEQVIFISADGLKIHAQLFRGQRKSVKKPAIVYIHGGPSRQMLLGWNYSEYYANAYATNQYLASLGFDVLSVNYRMGIGYGDAFQRAGKNGDKGAAEYLDIKAAGEWLAKQPDVDPKRIGVYGGSYGGYLTNMALAKDSRLFAAGVSIHSIGDMTVGDMNKILMPDRYERAPDALEATKVAWQSSPVAYLSGWTSPVLLIHGDDDRNVRFSESTDLNVRLEALGVKVETLVIPDDTHHWMKYGNLMKVNHAMVEFFIRHLKPEL